MERKRKMMRKKDRDVECQWVREWSTREGGSGLLTDPSRSCPGNLEFMLQLVFRIMTYLSTTHSSGNFCSSTKTRDGIACEKRPITEGVLWFKAYQ